MGRDERAFGPNVRVISTSVKNRPEDREGSGATAAEQHLVSASTLSVSLLSDFYVIVPFTVSHERVLKLMLWFYNKAQLTFDS